MIEIKLTSLQSGTAEEYHYLEVLDEKLNAGNIPKDVLALFAGTDRATGYSDLADAACPAYGDARVPRRRR